MTDEALPEGNFQIEKHGYLYFYYKGKLANLKSLELLYRGAVFKLK